LESLRGGEKLAFVYEFRNSGRMGHGRGLSRQLAHSAEGRAMRHGKPRAQGDPPKVSSPAGTGMKWFSERFGEGASFLSATPRAGAGQVRVAGQAGAHIMRSPVLARPRNVLHLSRQSNHRPRPGPSSHYTRTGRRVQRTGSTEEGFRPSLKQPLDRTLLQWRQTDAWRANNRIDC
jgi:hypothetical protein